MNAREHTHMEITATVRNAAGTHEVLLRTDATTQPLAIAAKAAGRGSAVNGGELLMLALATCYCNDLYPVSYTHLTLPTNREV